ncbi:hypothetical protein L0156_15470 [bacterium]|nr:hypothetical protein [bacterium]
MKITNQNLTYVKPVERPDKAVPSTTSIPTEAIPRGYSEDPYLTKEKAQQMLMAQQQKANVAMTSAVRQSELNEQLRPIDERLNTKGDQFIGDSKTIAQSGINLPGWDAKSIEAANRDELSKILEGDKKDPSGQKNYLDALNKSNPSSDEQIMKDAEELIKQKNVLEGGSKLGNKVRDVLAARGISGAYADRIDGGASPKVEREKDNGTRVGPDVSTLSPAFEPGKQPWDFKTEHELMGGITGNAPAKKTTNDPPVNRQRVIFQENGVEVVMNSNGTREVHSRHDNDESKRIVPGSSAVRNDPKMKTAVFVKGEKDGTEYLVLIPKEKGVEPTIYIFNNDHEGKPDGMMILKNGIYSDPDGQPINEDPNKKRPVEDETPRGKVDKADALGFQRKGPVDPAPELLSGRNEAQIDRLAEGVAIGIMSKINPKPYDSGGSSGPIVVGGNPIADPLEPPVPKRTNVKPRKPDGPVGPGDNSPVTPGSGGEQLTDPDNQDTVS